MSSSSAFPGTVEDEARVETSWDLEPHVHGGQEAVEDEMPGVLEGEERWTR